MPGDVSFWLLSPQNFTQETQYSRADVQVPETLPANLPALSGSLWLLMDLNAMSHWNWQVSLKLRSSVPVPSRGTAATLYSSPPSSHLPSPQGGGSQGFCTLAPGLEWGGRDWEENTEDHQAEIGICLPPEVTTGEGHDLAAGFYQHSGGQRWGIWKFKATPRGNQYVFIWRKIGGSLQSVGSLWVPRTTGKPLPRPQVLAGPGTWKQMQTSSADLPPPQIRKCFQINLINNPRSTQGLLSASEISALNASDCFL